MKVLNQTLLEKMLHFINDYQFKNGKSPSYRVIMHEMKLNNLAMVYRYVNRLQADGKLTKSKVGGIEISSKFKQCRTIHAPLVGTVTCGSPITAFENIEGTYSLPADIFGSGETFLLHAKGDSMKNVGIKNNDILVIKKTDVAQNNDIVVALLGEEATVKRFFKRGNKFILHPENEMYEDIIVHDVKILGKVVSFIHQF